MHVLGHEPAVVNSRVGSGVCVWSYVMPLPLSIWLAEVPKYQVLTIVFIKGSRGMQAVVCDGSSASVCFDAVVMPICF